MRVTVNLILNLLANGMSSDDISKAYPIMTAILASCWQGAG